MKILGFFAALMLAVAAHGQGTANPGGGGGMNYIVPSPALSPSSASNSFVLINNGSATNLTTVGVSNNGTFFLGGNGTVGTNNSASTLTVNMRTAFSKAPTGQNRIYPLFWLTSGSTHITTNNSDNQSFNYGGPISGNRDQHYPTTHYYIKEICLRYLAANTSDPLHTNLVMWCRLYNIADGAYNSTTVPNTSQASSTTNFSQFQFVRYVNGLVTYRMTNTVSISDIAADLESSGSPMWGGFFGLAVNRTAATNIATGGAITNVSTHNMGGYIIISDVP